MIFFKINFCDFQFFYSKKFGGDVQLKGTALLFSLLQNHKNAFTFIVPKPMVNYVKLVSLGLRDFDEISEILGKFLLNFFLLLLLLNRKFDF